MSRPSTATVTPDQAKPELTAVGFEVKVRSPETSHSSGKRHPPSSRSAFPTIIPPTDCMKDQGWLVSSKPACATGVASSSTSRAPEGNFRMFNCSSRFLCRPRDSSVADGSTRPVEHVTASDKPPELSLPHIRPTSKSTRCSAPARLRPTASSASSCCQRPLPSAMRSSEILMAARHQIADQASLPRNRTDFSSRDPYRPCQSAQKRP
jgi:hypothetical protein